MRRWGRIAMSTLSVLTLVLGSVTTLGCGKDEAKSIRETVTDTEATNALRSRGSGAQRRQELQEEEAERKAATK